MNNFYLWMALGWMAFMAVLVALACVVFAVLMRHFIARREAQGQVVAASANPESSATHKG